MMPPVDKQRPARIQAAGGKPSVLIIDDDSNTQKVFGTMLAAGGYNVVQAFSGDAGLVKFRIAPSGTFAAVVCDRNVPQEKHGDAVVRAIKRIDPNQPVIMCTANLEKLTAAERDMIGADRYVDKSTEVLFTDLLLRTVREIARNKV